MEAYYTPVKQLHSSQTRTTRTSGQTREGDWVCINCNNLNFSFRKKCNRCKIQTRHDNESVALLLNYYEKSYALNTLVQQECGGGSHEGCSHGATTASANSHPLVTPNRSDKENKTPEKRNRELPSVSPLVKKYNARETTPLSEVGSEDSVWGVTVRDFEDVLAFSGRSEECEEGGEESLSNDDLERMISSIML